MLDLESEAMRGPGSIITQIYTIFPDLTEKLSRRKTQLSVRCSVHRTLVGTFALALNFKMGHLTNGI